MSALPDLPPEHRARVDRAVARFESAKGRHEAHRKRWEHFYALYRGYQAFKRDYTGARPRDVDEVLRENQRKYGDTLLIPYAFSVIETTLPRMLSNNPRMLVLPRATHDRERANIAEENVETMRLMLDVQQTQMDYPLILQDVGKSGLMYGLGVQKVYWDCRYKTKRVLQPPTVQQAGGAEWVEGRKEGVLVFDGPWAEAVDVFDFLWDPAAHDMASARFVIHRTWRDDAYVKRMLERSADKGGWSLPPNVKLEDLEGLGGSGRDELRQKRDRAAGVSADEGKEKLHEVWEVHDDGQVTTLLDRVVDVSHGGNPFWHGEMPFQIYRPTRVPHEFAGIGEIEAIEDLIQEMSELRTSRRDNARLVLQRPFAYLDGAVEVGDIAFGPAVGIPVEGADPREVIFPLPLQDIPASGYQEEANLQRDIERVSGIDDTVSGGEGGGGASATATGVQLVQAAANVRIQNKTKLLETEVVKHAAKQMVELNQQKIVKTRFVAGPPKPGEADRTWSWYTIGPEQLAGEFDVQPEGGSMQPENVPQKRADAQAMLAAAGQLGGLVKPENLVEYVLENLGIDNPRSWLAPQEQQIPMHALEEVGMALQQLAEEDPDALLQLADPAFLQQLLMGAMQQQAPEEQEPSPEQQQQEPPAAAPVGAFE